MDLFIYFQLLDHDGPVGIDRAVLLLPVAFKAGGLNLRFGTNPLDTSTGYDSSTGLLFELKARGRELKGSLRTRDTGSHEKVLLMCAYGHTRSVPIRL